MVLIYGDGKRVSFFVGYLRLLKLSYVRPGNELKYD